MIYIYILLAVLLFGALVAIHELGHFITAKLSGVRVNEFAIGMGPAIFKKKFGETTYALRILPFGGFCAMEGEDSESEDPRAFGAQSVWSRMLIVLAGSFMNLLGGFVVLALVFAPIKEWYTPTIESVGADISSEENVLRAGDTIKAIGDYNVYIYSDIMVGLTRGGDNGKYDVKVMRDGKIKMLTDVVLTSSEEEAEKAKGNNGEARTITFRTETHSFAGKTKYVLQNGFNLVRLVKVGLVDLLSGSVSKDDISGPVGIGKMMADTAKTSMSSLWYLLAFISINLGVMNLLPIPALDGGRFVFLLFEAIFRKPVPPKYEAYVHGVGIVILLLLMLLVTFNDVVKLFR